MIMIILITSCKQNSSKREVIPPTVSKVIPPTVSKMIPPTVSEVIPPSVREEIPAGAVLIARDIVTEVTIRPDPEGDPWEVEKVAGYQGNAMLDTIFGRIYDGILTVYEYHSGNALTVRDVRKIEEEFNNDRTKIGKLSFTEDWYYFPSSNSLQKRTKSVTFGYELYNNTGKVYAYSAAFRADLN